MKVLQDFYEDILIIRSFIDTLFETFKVPKTDLTDLKLYERWSRGEVRIYEREEIVQMNETRGADNLFQVKR